MLYAIGGINISDDFANNVVNLVISLFLQFKRVFVGGLFIIHGLTVAIEERMEKYVETLLSYIASALDVT
jgi:predicted DNA-binding helix-hairpin-helix protein